MAVYKVIQDIEAEDKLIGFLTLKGFIYAAIAAVSMFLEFRLLIAGSLGPIRWPIMLLLLGPIILFGVLASPLGREQPTEIWLLSRIKFFFKPHKRTWDQSGINHLVTITAPKRIERNLVKNLSQTEVKSRLQALAGTLDSRGWSVKSTVLDSSVGTTYLTNGSDSDRLIGPSNLRQDEPVIDVHEADDIMDEQNNPTAQKFANMMQQADDKRKKEIVSKINAARTGGTDTTFLDTQIQAGGSSTTFVGTKIVAPNPSMDDTATDNSLTPAEQELLERKHREEAEIESKLPKTFRGEAIKLQRPNQPPAPQVTPEVQAAKLELAQSGNDLSVASIAHLANRKNVVQQIGPNEFEIDLH